MNREQKHQHAEYLKNAFSKAKVAVFADYKGLKALDADQLRHRLRETKAEVKVVKNNVLRQALKDIELSTEAKKMLDGLVGPTLVAFAFEDPAASAKVVQKFKEGNEVFQLKDSLMGTRRVSVAEVEALASLPGREVLLGMLLSAMSGPARGFVTVLSGVPRGLVTVLSAIEKKKQESA